MKIRKAVTSDVSKLFALEQKLFTSDNFALSRSSFYYHVKNNMLLVAELQDEIAGYVLVLTRSSYAKLYSIGVCETYRSQKVGFKLLKAVSSELISLGLNRLVLEVRVDNERAIVLYKNFGFIVKKQLKDFYRDGCDAYLMELQQY